MRSASSVVPLRCSPPTKIGVGSPRCPGAASVTGGLWHGPSRAGSPRTQHYAVASAPPVTGGRERRPTGDPRSTSARGVASARNSGIRAARGELIGLLDGDDLWLPERLTKLVPVLEARPDLGMVTSDSFMMDETVATTRHLYREQRKRPFPESEDLQIAEIACYNFMFVSVVFRRELVDRFGMFTDGMRRAEDYELW